MSINIIKQGWIELSLEEVCSQIVGGGTPSTKIIQYWQGNIPWITSADILDIKTVLPKRYITVDAIKNSATNIVPKGTIIVVTRVSLGKIAIAPFDLCFSQDNQGLIFYDNIVDANYALFYLYIAVFSFKYSGRGTTINGVTKNQLKNLLFRFPPLPEQRAIVSKIEQLFSELDSGVENLKKAQAQLKVYRQAVLKWAFEGKLTEEWRKQQKDLPTAETLLAQIKTEREKQAEKSNKKLKPIPPISIEELADLPKLPEGWVYGKLREIAIEVSDGDHQPPPKTETGIPFITISNILSNNKIDFSNTLHVSEKYYNGLKETRKPFKGDILYTVTGSFGIPVLIDFEKEFCFQRHIGLIRPSKSLNQKWLYFLLQSPQVFNQAKEVATGTAQKTVSLEGLRNFILLIVSNEEQNQIVLEIEDRLSVCDKLEETIAQSLQKTESLRQSILKKAFAGKLLTKTELEQVRKAPDWEPAEKLLQRIKQEKNEKG